MRSEGDRGEGGEVRSEGDRGEGGEVRSEGDVCSCYECLLSVLGSVFS